MRPTRTSIAAVENGTPVILDIYDRSQVSVQVDVTGTINYTVQMTMDNLFDSSITPLWMDHPDPNLVGATTDQQSGCPYTPFALRIVQNSGAGSAVMTVLSGSFN